MSRAKRRGEIFVQELAGHRRGSCPLARARSSRGRRGTRGEATAARSPASPAPCSGRRSRRTTTTTTSTTTSAAGAARTDDRRSRFRRTRHPRSRTRRRARDDAATTTTTTTTTTATATPPRVGGAARRASRTTRGRSGGDARRRASRRPCGARASLTRTRTRWARLSLSEVLASCRPIHCSLLRARRGGRRVAMTRPREPLVILREAALPLGMDAPWASSSARRGERGERDDDDDDDGASFSGRIVASGGTVSAPVATLPRPLLLASASDDAPGDVGAHPDTLRALSLVSGDLVALTVDGERGVPRRANRRRDALGRGDGGSGRGGGGRRRRRRSRRRADARVLYLPPRMRRDLGVHLTEATATASGARPFAAASVRARRVESEDAIPRAGAMTVAALRRPPPSLPSPPTAREDRWVPGGARKRRWALISRRRGASRSATCSRSPRTIRTKTRTTTTTTTTTTRRRRRRANRSTSSCSRSSPTPPTDDDRRDRRRRRDGVGGVMLASRAWTRCALAPRGAAAGAAAAGALSVRRARVPSAAAVDASVDRRRRFPPRASAVASPRR